MSASREEIHELAELAIEGRLSPVATERLEFLVQHDPEARRLYAELLHQHATLQWSVADPSFLPIPKTSREFVEADIGQPISLQRQSASQRSPNPVFGRWSGSLVAASVALMCGIGFSQWWHSAPAYVATLVESRGCKWDSGSLATLEGEQLPAGRLKLAEGIARLTFASGAEIKLEAPAELELVTNDLCRLHSGRLVAKVPERAVGFRVETPTAIIKDLGTEFGVNVQEGVQADVQVFNGRVDVRHRSSGRLEQMKTGDNLRFGQARVAQFNPLTEPPPLANALTWRGRPVTFLQISTATGKGKDAYIRPPIPMRDGPEAILLVKNTKDDLYARKAYLGMDLTPLAGLRIVEASLSLTLAPTELGFASEVPDAIFGVYGLTDERLDDWGEKSIRWENAPANLPGGDKLDQSKVSRLGQFEIRQGVLQGTRSISGQALVDFLNHDSNGMATLILVRETKGSGRVDLVHGFAGKHHPQLLPPTLKVQAVPRVSEE